MDGGLDQGAWPGRNSIAIAMTAMALLLVASIGAVDVAGAKGKKVHACVVKKGPDKGVMSFSKTGKCQKGEKKLSWGKKGKRGKQGPAGAKGDTGPQGSSGVTDQLLATIATQQTEIDQLTTQLTTVTTQLDALKSQVSGLAPQVDALCREMPKVVTQSNGLLTAITPIPLVGVLPPALSAFSCP